MALLDEPNLPLPWLLSSVAVRTAIVLIVLVFAIRLLGKRDVGSLDLIDIVAVLLVGNAIQNALTYGSGSLWVGLVSAGALLLIDRVVGILFVRRPWLEQRVFGEPTIIARDGRLDSEVMRRAGVTEDEVLSAARALGLVRVEQIRLAVLEADGTISIVRKEDDGGSDNTSGERS